MDEKFLELIECISTLREVSGISSSVWAEATTRVEDYLLPEQSYGEDRPSEDKDFTQHRLKSQVGLNCLEAFLRNLERLSQPEINKSFLVSALLLCGEHVSSNLWNTLESVETSKKCLQLLLILCKCKSVSDLFNNELFGLVLITIRPKLLKGTWRLHPAAVHCYHWMLQQVKSTYLSEHLYSVLPTALIMIDDHIVTRRIIGINCVTIILKNVARTELCSQGWDNVLYHTLRPLLLQSEPELVIPVYTCMSTLLASTEQGYTRSVGPGEWSRLESTLLALLRNMECEDRLVLRCAYAQSLEAILKAMGPAVIQLSKKLLCIFEEYLDKNTPDTRHHTLSAFHRFVLNSKERLPSNGERITFLLLKTLYDMTGALSECETCARKLTDVSGQILNDELTPSTPLELCSKHQWIDDLRTVIGCLNFVKLCVPFQFDSLRDDVNKKVNFNPLLVTILDRTFHAQ